MDEKQILEELLPPIQNLLWALPSHILMKELYCGISHGYGHQNLLWVRSEISLIKKYPNNLWIDLFIKDNALHISSCLFTTKEVKYSLDDSNYKNKTVKRVKLLLAKALETDREDYLY